MRTDAELVNTALDGEKQAFAVLVKRYERPVRAVALNVLADHHLAKDAGDRPGRRTCRARYESHRCYVGTHSLGAHCETYLEKNYEK